MKRGSIEIRIKDKLFLDDLKWCIIIFSLAGFISGFLIMQVWKG